MIRGSGRLGRIIRLDEAALPASTEDLDKYTAFQIDRRNVPEDYRKTAFGSDRRR